MDIIKFPENFSKLIFELSPIFTRPSFNHFKVVLSAILFGSPKKTLTSGIRLFDLKCHFSNIHRFVGRYQWDLTQLTSSILLMIVKHLHLSKEFLFALDDTLVPKYGPKIFGRAKHRDHAAKAYQPNFVMGHKWLVLGLLHYSKTFSKWICFPMLSRLFVPKKATPENEEYFKPLAIAVSMLKEIKSIVNTKLTLVADGLYGKKDLIRYCIQGNISFISRIRSDAALYETPPAYNFGRPRKYGKRLPILRQLSADENDFQEYHLKLYGEERSVRVKKIVAIWKPAGQLIQVLITDFDNSKNFSYFFSTDLKMPVKKILSIVAARWSIETLFCDLKTHLGMEDWQCRIQNAVVRSIPLTCAATSLLMLWSLMEAQQKEPEFWDVQPWYSNKSSPSILDMIHQLKARSLSTNIFSVLRQKGITAEKYRQIEFILRQAA
jgi:hypothetical protein